MATTCVVRDGEKLDIALAPTASVLLRGDSGMRLGAAAIARYDAGRSSAGVTATPRQIPVFEGVEYQITAPRFHQH